MGKNETAKTTMPLKQQRIQQIRTGLLRILLAMTAWILLMACGNGQQTGDQSNPSISYNELTIEQLNDEIRNGAFGNMHSLLIELDGRLIAETYAAGFDRDTLQPVYSVSKSITSALIGIAIDNGDLPGTDTSMISFFEDDYEELEYLDDAKRSISIFDLLTMQTGLRWDAGRLEEEQLYDNDTEALIDSPDWIKYVLDLPVDIQPGTVFSYCNGATTLLSGILQRSSGYTAEAYAARYLFGPLDIDTWLWESGPKGITAAAWGLNLRSLDMLKFGRLFLDHGDWQEAPVISSEWIRESTMKHTEAGDFDYGYGWWRFSDDHEVASMLTVNDAFFARGLGDQFILIIPHLRLVVVSTADNAADDGYFFRSLTDYILPAIVTSS